MSDLFGNHIVGFPTRWLIYIFIAIALDEGIVLDVLHVPMKTLRSHMTISHAYGQSDIKASQ